MAVKTQINDPATGKEAIVSKYNALTINDIFPDVPPVGTANRYRYLGGFLGTAGLGLGTLDEAVDGSVTPVEFYVAANNDYDIHITHAMVFVGNTTIAHPSFGGGAPLTNGWDLKSIESDVDSFLIEKAKSLSQIIMQTGAREGYGDGAKAWEITAFGTAGLDGFVATIHISQYIPGGIRIGRGTVDRFVSVINDNAVGHYKEMLVRVMGYRHYP